MQHRVCDATDANDEMRTSNDQNELKCMTTVSKALHAPCCYCKCDPYI